MIIRLMSNIPNEHMPCQHIISREHTFVSIYLVSICLVNICHGILVNIHDVILASSFFAQLHYSEQRAVRKITCPSAQRRHQVP